MMRQKVVNAFGALFLVMVLVLPGILLAAATIPDKFIETAVSVNSDVFIPVLTYHRILNKVKSPFDLTPGQLDAEFRYFKQNGYHPITAAQMIAFMGNPSRFPVKPIVLTFDDGHISHYTKVYPLLKKYGFNATFFVYPNLIVKKSKLLLTWDELSEMARAGEDIESHTLSHPYLTDRGQYKSQSAYMAWLDNELAGSRRIIQNAMRKPVNFLAYPYGWFNATVETEAQKAGYQAMFTVNWGNNPIDVNPLRIKRHVMSNRITQSDLERIVTARPLKLQIISPADTSIVTQSPVIQFKLANPGIQAVEVDLRLNRYVVKPDSRGVYTVKSPAGMKRGYYMIILKAYDRQINYYLDSWGFDYDIPLKK